MAMGAAKIAISFLQILVLVQQAAAMPPCRHVRAPAQVTLTQHC